MGPRKLFLKMTKEIKQIVTSQEIFNSAGQQMAPLCLDPGIED